VGAAGEEVDSPGRGAGLGGALVAVSLCCPVGVGRLMVRGLYGVGVARGWKRGAVETGLGGIPGVSFSCCMVASAALLSACAAGEL
jgi:hypothetical protein